MRGGGRSVFIKKREREEDMVLYKDRERERWKRKAQVRYKETNCRREWGSEEIPTGTEGVAFF